MADRPLPQGNGSLVPVGPVEGQGMLTQFDFRYDGNMPAKAVMTELRHEIDVLVKGFTKDMKAAQKKLTAERKTLEAALKQLTAPDDFAKSLEGLAKAFQPFYPKAAVPYGDDNKVVASYQTDQVARKYTVIGEVVDQARRSCAVAGVRKTYDLPKAVTDILDRITAQEKVVCDFDAKVDYLAERRRALPEMAEEAASQMAMAQLESHPTGKLLVAKLREASKVARGKLAEEIAGVVADDAE